MMNVRIIGRGGRGGVCAWIGCGEDGVVSRVSGREGDVVGELSEVEVLEEELHQSAAGLPERTESAWNATMSKGEMSGARGASFHVTALNKQNSAVLVSFRAILQLPSTVLTAGTPANAVQQIVMRSLSQSIN